jgi:hypothetical protein
MPDYPAKSAAPDPMMMEFQANEPELTAALRFGF